MSASSKIILILSGLAFALACALFVREVQNGRTIDGLEAAASLRDMADAKARAEADLAVATVRAELAEVRAQIAADSTEARLHIGLADTKPRRPNLATATDSALVRIIKWQNKR